MLALFHDKKCCNYFNFVLCILWDFIVLGLVLSWWRLKLNWWSVQFATSSWEDREKGSHEKAIEKHMSGSWRVVPDCQFCEYFTGKAFPTYLECRECFGAWEALRNCQKKLVRLGGCNRAYCGIQRARKDIVPRSLVGLGAWRA